MWTISEQVYEGWNSAWVLYSHNVQDFQGGALMVEPHNQMTKLKNCLELAFFMQRYLYPAKDKNQVLWFHSSSCLNMKLTIDKGVNAKWKDAVKLHTLDIPHLTEPMVLALVVLYLGICSHKKPLPPIVSTSCIRTNWRAHIWMFKQEICIVKYKQLFVCFFKFCKMKAILILKSTCCSDTRFLKIKYQLFKWLN